MRQNFLGLGGGLTVLPEPVEEPLDSLFHAHLGLPSRRGVETPRVRDIVALVRSSPRCVAQKHRFALEPLDPLRQFQQADGIARPSSYIEGNSPCAVDMAMGENHGLHEIFDEKNVPDLLSIPVDRNRQVLQCLHVKWAIQPWSSVPNW